jgi:hypothetical protein
MKTLLTILFIFLIFSIKAQMQPDPIPFRKGEKWGFCDRGKKIIIPIQFEEVMPFEEGLAKVKMNGTWGMIDKNGREIIKCQFSEIQSFKSGFCLTSKQSKWGAVDRYGKEVVPCQFEEVVFLCDKFFKAKKGNTFALYSDARELLSTVCEEITVLKDEIVRFKMQGKWGFISKPKNEIIQAKYEGLSEFVNGLAKVSKNGKSGYVDTNGIEFFED